MHDKFIRSYELQGPIAMMDCDKEFRYFAVGGRQNLQIIEINPNPPFDSIFIKRGAIKAKGTNECQMSRPAVNDLSWNKLVRDKIAVGSTAGMVSIYEINSEIRSKLIGVKKQHESNVSKVEWSPHSGNILITASLDNELKVWDIRVQNEVFTPIINNVEFESERKIRDVKFNPHQEEQLALGYDSGGLELFDLRKMIVKGPGSTLVLSEAPKANLVSIMFNQEGHSRAVNSLDWNPSVRHTLASACLQKKIKVWDVSSTSMQRKETIEHISSVSIIRWMTRQQTIIGACSLNDSQIYFYDTNRKFRPKSIFKGHTDVVKSFLYDPNQEYMVSASLIANSTNSNLIVQSLKNYIDPYETCPRLPVTIDPFNNILFNLENVNDIDVEERVYLRSPRLYKDYSQLNHMHLNQKEEFLYLHKNYMRSGNKEDIVKHNIKVAMDIGKSSCAYLWKNIFTIAFPDLNQTHTIESLYQQRIDANVTVSEERITLNEKSKYRKEVAHVDIEQVLQQFLDEEGQLQTIAIVVICLLGFDRALLKQHFVENIIMPYIELLRKLELFAVASRTVLDSGLDSLTRASNAYTLFKIGCGQCKDSIKEGVACPTCKTIPLCTLCQQPLNGLVIWCQYCAHGGHIRQYRDWFAKEEVCPYGCRHKCFTFN